MVVDGAVVVIENIGRHHDEENLNPNDAAIKGTHEVFFAVLVGVTTTVIVLIPFQFLTGFVGKVFGLLSLTMIYAFGSSILRAITLIPLLFVLFEKKETRIEQWITRTTAPFNRGMDKLRDGYLWLLRWSLNRRALLLVNTLIVFIISMVMLRMRGMEVLPKPESMSEGKRADGRHSQLDG